MSKSQAGAAQNTSTWNWRKPPIATKLIKRVRIKSFFTEILGANRLPLELGNELKALTPHINDFNARVIA